MLQNAFTLTSQKVAKKLESGLNKGLSNKEAAKRLLKYKDNEILIKESQIKWKILISPFLDTIITTLL
ncbi:cation-transporting P-type ATPase [Yeosuana sp.]|uniref:cation-transporting P-type ATPase n=1 Tax=Yeosuana sp. TaxID=2529388 RepID=UPI0040552E19|tara:strand:- start:5655 stop:5858 length:204 start_codon:yes stop_codon:yes gene_type:complete